MTTARVLALLPRRSDWTAARRAPVRDLVAGSTVALVALPLALAFGVTSGLGAEAGLITAIVAGTDGNLWFSEPATETVARLSPTTGGITEFVPLSFIPFNTMLGRTHGIEEISMADNLKHTAAFRLALGRTIPNLQASWVKMGLEGATESLRWGVNDLGGTLMEETISRMAGSEHGSRRTPAELTAIATTAGRPARQRTTTYGEVAATRRPALAVLD